MWEYEIRGISDRLPASKSGFVTEPEAAEADQKRATKGLASQ